MKNKKVSIFFLIIGVGSLVVFLDTFWSKQNERFTFLSFVTTKEINLCIFFILAVFFIYRGLKINLKNKNYEKNGKL
jgi:hypothetical protein